MATTVRRVGILHGAGYVARELIRLVAAHPGMDLDTVTSVSRAGQPASEVHPTLRGVIDINLANPADFDPNTVDVLFSCGHHGPHYDEIVSIDASGFEGVIVDLSANFRLNDIAAYPAYYGFEHAAPELLDRFTYGLTERNRDAIASSTRIANPGCFATGIALSLAPLAQELSGLSAHVVALTGASGSGATARQTTHFPDRDGNVRAYNVWKHRHTPEILQCLAHPVSLSFVPASGPWTYGIWGVLTIDGVPKGTDIGALFENAYADCQFVRLTHDALPELGHAARSPFCDIGWMTRPDGLVAVGFALDNLLKGAASAAIQNANVALGLDEATGLLPTVRATALS